jgi:hypothetical protein
VLFQYKANGSLSFLLFVLWDSMKQRATCYYLMGM